MAAAWRTPHRLIVWGSVAAAAAVLVTALVAWPDQDNKQQRVASGGHAPTTQSGNVAPLGTVDPVDTTPTTSRVLAHTPTSRASSATTAPVRATTPVPTPSAPHITEFPLPHAPSYPNAIATGPDGNLWFAESFTGKVGRITPSGAVTEFPQPNGAAGANGMAAGPDANLWFTDTEMSRIGRITTGGVFLPFYTAPNSVPVAIAKGPDGNVWFTDLQGKIGRMTPGGVVAEFPADGGPDAITSGPDGNLWFANGNNNAVGRITPAGVIAEYPVPTAGQNASITTGPDGNVWFTELSAGKVGRVDLR